MYKVAVIGKSQSCSPRTNPAAQTPGFGKINIHPSFTQFIGFWSQPF